MVFIAVYGFESVSAGQRCCEARHRAGVPPLPSGVGGLSVRLVHRFSQTCDGKMKKVCAVTDLHFRFHSQKFSFRVAQTD